MVDKDPFFRHFPIAPGPWRDILAGPDLASAREKVCAAIDPTSCLPPAEQVFAALSATPFPAVRVLIVGQDPYPTPGDAHGLSFSVAHGRPPRSLVNIFTEVQRDCGGERRSNANLSDWAEQGVLLLNRVLTTPPAQAGGHRRCGWEAITAALVRALAARKAPLVALLWGNDAASLDPVLRESSRVRVLGSGHPSPLAYNRSSANGFKGCGHFAATNAQLRDWGLPPIRWAE